MPGKNSAETSPRRSRESKIDTDSISQKKSILNRDFQNEIGSRHKRISTTLSKLVGEDGIGSRGQKIKLAFENIQVSMMGQQILKGISGEAKPGQVLSIMGPSGSGKTTLLNALAGRQALSGGRISLNGHGYHKGMKRHIAYVLQDEVFFGVMTVRQVMYFTAYIRLPDSMSDAEKESRADKIMMLLGIDRCADSIVGTMFQRGISGGERKRLNIGVQLITWPSMILLDEPTSGLDSSTAYDVILLTRELAKLGCTIVCTVHQPSSALFQLFDKLLVLARGQTFYQGEAQNVVKHMEAIGFVCPTNFNPGDFVLELAKSDAALKTCLALPDKTRGNVVDSLQAITNPRNPSHASFMSQNLQQTEGKQSQEMLTIKLESAPTVEELHAHNADGKEGKKFTDSSQENSEVEDESWDNTFVTSWWTQFKALHSRAMIVKQSDTFDTYSMTQIAAVGIIVALIWFQTDKEVSSIQDNFGLIFFIAIFWTFFPMFNAVSTFPAERAVLLRERAQGSYRLSAYYCAKMAAEMPLNWIMPSLFIIFVYWMTNINDDVETFFGFWFMMVLNVELAVSIGMLISAAEVNTKRALVVLSILVLGSMLFGGFYINLDNIPVWLRWLQWLSFVKYTFGALITIAYSDIDFTCDSVSVSSEFDSCQPGGDGTVTGGDILESRGIDDLMIVYAMVVLAAAIVVKFATYFTLFYRYKPKSPTTA